MALIKCPECGKEISDQADFCPNCGYGFEGKKRKKAHANNGRDKTSTGMILNTIATISWIVLIAYIFLALGGVNAYATKEKYNVDNLEPFSAVSRGMDGKTVSKFIELDQVSECKDDGYKIDYVVGKNRLAEVSSPTSFYIELCGIVLICILGFVIYRMKNSNNKMGRVLPFVYLGLTILTMVAFTFTSFLFIITVLGIPVILFIIQIVAAIKYISGARLMKSAVLDS